MSYYIGSAICLFFLAMIPIWTAGSDNPSYPFGVLAVLAVLVVVVPMMFRPEDPRRRD
jgi:hypothetical protein